MERGTVDFDKMPLSLEEKEKFHRENFSYRDGDPIPQNWSESTERYAKALKYLKDRDLENEFKNIVQTIRNSYSQELERMNMKSSPWGESDAWIKWDIAKQLYFFLSANQPHNARYRIANPLVDEILQQEIVNRHIGWEYWYQNEKVREIIDGPQYRSTFNNFTRPTGTEISSWGLALLGERLREIK